MKKLAKAKGIFQGKDTNKEDMPKAKRMAKEVPKANKKKDKGSSGAGRMKSAKKVAKKDKK